MSLRVISLTSIPPRFSGISATLESLLRQNVELVNLYIPYSYRRFPDWDGELPFVPKGVNIRRCTKDYGPATKILPAAREYRDVDAQILFCDDDCIVPKGWAKRIFALQHRRPNEAVAYYGRRYYPFDEAQIGLRNAFELKTKWDIRYRSLCLIKKYLDIKPPFKRPIYKSGFVDVFFGVGGVVVDPKFFDSIAYDVPNEVWLVDDIWLSATMARQGIPIFVPAFGAIPQTTSNSSNNALLDLEAFSKTRKELNLSASEYCRAAFKIW